MLQLGYLSQAKQLQLYDSALRQWDFSVSQSGSQLAGHWSVSHSVSQSIGQSFSQSMINQSDISNLVGQSVWSVSQLCI